MIYQDIRFLQQLPDRSFRVELNDFMRGLVVVVRITEWRSFLRQIPIDDDLEVSVVDGLIRARKV